MRTNLKQTDSVLGNRSFLKPYDNGMLQSTFNIEKKLEKISRPITIEVQDQ